MRLGRTLRELDASIDCRELALWSAFLEIEPLGGPAFDWVAGLAPAIMINQGRGKESGQAPMTPTDLVPWAKPAPIELDDDEAVAMFDRLVGLEPER